MSATKPKTGYQQEFNHSVALYCTFYFFFTLIIYQLFKKIVRVEQDKISELTYRAEHDLLTGLYNHSVLKKTPQTKKKNIPYSLLYIDLDHFKTINDSYRL